MLDKNDLQEIQKLIAESESRVLEQSAHITEKLIAESEARVLEQSARITEKLIAESEARVLEQSAHNTKVILESYVEPKFNLLAEGQQTIMDMLTPKSEIEDLRNEIDLLKMVIRTMSSDIAELKQAQ